MRQILARIGRSLCTLRTRHSRSTVKVISPHSLDVYQVHASISKGATSHTSSQSSSCILRRPVIKRRATPSSPATHANSQKSSRETLSWPDGTYFDGNVVNGRLTGIGFVKYPDGSWYKGALINGKPQGRGRLVWPDGKKQYIGLFDEGQPSGSGILRLSDGRIYEGEFKNGLPDGSGVEYGPDGTHAKVVYSQGRFVSQAPFPPRNS